MSVRPELLIRGLDELPVPPSDLLAEIERRVAGAGLLYTKAAWAITLKWRESDPRWRFIQSGEMQPAGAFDVVGYLPITCSLDEAPALIERELKNWPEDAFRELRDAVTQWNDVGREAAVEDTVMGEVWNDIDKGPGTAAPAPAGPPSARGPDGKFKPRPKPRPK